MKKFVSSFVFLLCFASTGLQAASRCTETPKRWFSPATISCSYDTLSLPSSSVTSREVKFEVPLGSPPAGGWPVVVIYQGSFFPVEFTRTSDAPGGGIYEAKLIKTMLDNGYAVIAPRAAAELAWLTNSAGPLTAYELTTDYVFLNNVFDAIEDGIFGPLNPNRKYATGISSGGYNTSRMAVSFPGEFKALMIQAGSYATCLGPTCSVPNNLPSDHPPTFFVHGFVDAIVPWWTMDRYYDRLLSEGIDTGRHTEALGGHEWFPESAGLALQWFNGHP